MKVRLTDIEKLSVLPYRQKFGQFISTKLECYTYKSWYDRRDFFNSDFLRKVKKMILGSVGLHIDDVLSKVSKILPSNCPYSNYYILERYIDYDERQGYKDDKWRYDGLYIDNEGFIRRYTSCKKKRYTKHNSEWSKIRKLQKERDKVINSTLINIINKKLLYEFYVKLLKEEKQNIKDLEQKEKYALQERKKVFNSRWWDTIWGYFYMKDVKLLKSKLITIKESISKIENGEYNIFYESNVYLYSLQKECHHFESPIKQ